MSTPPPLMSMGAVREPVWDVIRGLGILGIFSQHVFVFSSPMSETAVREVTLVDDWVWLLVGALANGKFIAVLATTFGAGFAMVAARDLQRGHSLWSARRRLMWRCAVLLGLGVLHYLLLFWGDILQWYGLSGVLVALLVGVSDRVLKWVAMSCLAAALGVGVLMSGAQVLAVRLYPGFEDTMWQAVEEELATFAVGSYLQQVFWRLAFYPTVLAIMIPEVALIVGLMSAGMLVWRRGWLTKPSAHPEVVRWTLLAGLGVGLPLNLLTALATSPTAMTLVMYPQRVLGGVLLGGAMAMLLALAVERGAVRWLTWLLGCVGRRALTCYLLQSLLGNLVFFSWGLGWYGQMSYAGQLAVLAAVWTVTVLTAVALELIGVRGPAEWAWRKLAPTS